MATNEMALDDKQCVQPLEEITCAKLQVGIPKRPFILLHWVLWVTDVL